MPLHVFVAMPYKIKQGIDFEAVYSQLIRPALPQEDFEVFRADEANEAGNIRDDMFQELLLADLVVVDITIASANVWYELGIRHGLRARGTVLIREENAENKFDIYTDRQCLYHLKEGKPDPSRLKEDIAAIYSMAKNSAASWTGKRVSPVFNHLPNLEEPEWKKLKSGPVRKFWEQKEDWDRRLYEAKRKGLAGDILVFADEAPISALNFEARIAAAKALRSQGHLKFALAQLERALEDQPNSLDAQREKGMVLGKLKGPDEALPWLLAILEKHPSDAETRSYVARLKKDEWMARWNNDTYSKADMKIYATNAIGLLKEAIQEYKTAFCNDPKHFYSGINTLTLMSLHDHLSDQPAFTNEISLIEGGIRWALHCAAAAHSTDESPEEKQEKEYWRRATIGDVEVLRGTPRSIAIAYTHAAAAANMNWFFVNSVLQQLHLLQKLDFKPENVAAGIAVMHNELQFLQCKQQWKPGKIVIFSGHMIDKKDRKQPRFPPKKEPAAAEAIAAELARLNCGENDVALCGGACGGDLIFAEECLKRNMKLELRLSFAEPQFIRESVGFAGYQWVDRFYAVKNNPLTKIFVMPEELGPHGKSNPFERNNRWQVYSALSHGPERVHAILLWDGNKGDSAGGTEHMKNEVERYCGRVMIIDVNGL